MLHASRQRYRWLVPRHLGFLRRHLQYLSMEVWSSFVYGSLVITKNLTEFFDNISNLFLGNTYLYCFKLQPTYFYFYYLCQQTVRRYWAKFIIFSGMKKRVLLLCYVITANFLVVSNENAGVRQRWMRPHHHSAAYPMCRFDQMCFANHTKFLWIHLGNHYIPQVIE